MRRIPLLLVLATLILLSTLLAGCRRSAIPPIDALVLEDEATAAMEEATNNTEGLTGSPEATDATPAETVDEPAPTEAVEPTEESVVVTEPEPVQPSPTESTAPTESAPVSGQATSHVVQPGDNLFRIALRYNTTVAALAQANNITNASVLSVGQRLVIPGSTGGESTTTPAAPTGTCSTTYVVKPGDNLFRIALRHNYSQAYLAQANGISNPALIQVGQRICIP